MNGSLVGVRQRPWPGHNLRVGAGFEKIDARYGSRGHIDEHLFVGVHARRSRLLFQKAFGDEIRSGSLPRKIGVMIRALVEIQPGRESRWPMK